MQTKQSKDILLCFAGSNQIQAHLVQKSLNPEPSFQFMVTAFSISSKQTKQSK